MDANLRNSLWPQFGAAIDYLAETIRACPEHLWRAPLWNDPHDRPEFAQFWYRAYHTLFWLDVYLFGSEENFMPPKPFVLIEQDDGGWALPERVYTKGELLIYLYSCREDCRAMISEMNDSILQRRHVFGWGECSFLELLIYNLRHVQEHAGQLNLFLGQNGIPAPDYEAQLRYDPL